MMAIQEEPEILEVRVSDILDAVPKFPRAPADEVSDPEAKEWVKWAARACGVNERTAIQKHKSWWGTVVIPSCRQRVARARARARNAITRDAARKVHMDRCHVAWHMANVPYPPTGAVASHSVIAFGMRWGHRTTVVRAIRVWAGVMRDQQKRNTTFGGFDE